MEIKVKIYVSTYCGFCTAAINLLEKNDISYESIILDNKPELRQKVSKENGNWRTVPMIFVNSEFIGGYTDLVELLKKGKLNDI